ncbi:unnamed protein product [Echinostoma caproni]|uniref:Protein kinase domain-containing protein n=1 Tax=Echinostoma caproni TaxID=27848 RepID=A0A183BAE9_9TREM|nr:unnamed protein product [Echinostoma caproni]
MPYESAKLYLVRVRQEHLMGQKGKLSTIAQTGTCFGNPKGQIVVKYKNSLLGFSFVNYVSLNRVHYSFFRQVLRVIIALLVVSTATFTFMFMELLPGGELFERIPIGVGLHVQQMFIYYAQILDALNYLHKEQFIAHLDVKPENIMLTKKDRAKLIDFGWAVDLRKTNFIQGPVGTTNYAAPEVFGKGSYLGPPADLFSLGVTLLTAVTGQRCWTRANPRVDAVYSQWVDRRNLHSGPVFSRLPPDLANFLTRALAHRPSERLTVDGIRAHPWFRRGLARRLTPVAPPISSATDALSLRNRSDAPGNLPLIRLTSSSNRIFVFNILLVDRTLIGNLVFGKLPRSFE